MTFQGLKVMGRSNGSGNGSWGFLTDLLGRDHDKRPTRPVEEGAIGPSSGSGQIGNGSRDFFYRETH